MRVKSLNASQVLPLIGASLLCLLPLAACDGGANSRPAVQASSLELADWEAHYDDSELVTWVQGQVRTPIDSSPNSGTAPVPEAEIELWAVTPDGLRFDRKIGECVSDSDGNFRVGPAPAERWAVRARKAGLASGLGGYRIGLPGALPLALNSPGLIGLRQGREVEVLLEDRSGAPQAGVEVQAFTMAFWDVTTTDENGKARLFTPTEGVVFSEPPVSGGALAKHVDVPRDGVLDIIRVPSLKDGHLHGRVIRGAGGPPVPGAWVVILGRPWVRAQADAEGRFQIAAFTGEYVAGLSSADGWRSFPVPAAGELELRLTAARPVEGRVNGPDGKPVANARVLALVPRIASGAERVWGPLTDDEGRFDFSWLPDKYRANQAPIRVVAVRRDLGVSQVVTVNEKTSELSLSLPGLRPIEGTFTHANGSRLENSRVEARWSYPGLTPGEAMRMGLPTESEAQLDAKGSFRFVGVQRGCGAEIVPDLEGWRQPVAVDEALPAGAVQTVSFLAPAGKPISGIVVTRGGDPLPPGGTIGVTLLGAARFEIDRRVPIRADGSFEMPDLPDGRYQVSAQVPGYERGGKPAVAGTQDLEVMVERRSPVSVVVRYPEGTAATDHAREIRVLLTDGYVESRETAVAAGAWTVQFPSMWPGDYEIQAAGGVWRGRVESIEVPDGRPLKVTVELERTLRQRAQLLEHDGTPVSGVMVVLSPQQIEGARPQNAHSAADGSLDLTGLVRGVWRLRAAPKGRAPLDARIEVDGTPSDVLRLKFPASGGLRLVIGSDERPLGGGIVSLKTADGSPVTAWAEGVGNLSSRFRVPKEGTITLTGLLIGMITIEVSHPDLKERLRKTVEVEIGQSPEIELR